MPVIVCVCVCTELRVHACTYTCREQRKGNDGRGSKAEKGGDEKQGSEGEE